METDPHFADWASDVGAGRDTAYGVADRIVRAIFNKVPMPKGEPNNVDD